MIPPRLPAALAMVLAATGCTRASTSASTAPPLSLPVCGPSADAGTSVAHTRPRDDGHRYYDVGRPDLVDVWVDPAHGDDARDGASRATALRTLIAAWERVPRGRTLDRGVRLLLMPGTYPVASMPEWIGDRRGTFEHPVVVQAADGPHTTRLAGTFDIGQSSYVYLIDLDVLADPSLPGGGNLLHFAGSDHLLVRNSCFDGAGGRPTDRRPQETIKINQCQHVYLEGVEPQGSIWYALDMFSAQYVHVLDSRFHGGGDSCVVLKGGTAYVRFDGNEIYDCNVRGFTAGEGSGADFMVAPWIHYDTYDVTFTNNVVHDTGGSGMGAAGSYDVLLAHNTLYRVGRANHTVEAEFCVRSCNGNAAACQQRIAAGGWAPPQVTGMNHGLQIPNRHLWVFDNVVYNPPGMQSGSVQVMVYGPRTNPAGTNAPSPARTDDDLRIEGNVFFNGPPDLPIVPEESQYGCRDANPTCNLAQLRRDNAFNAGEPLLVDPDHGDFRPVPGGLLAARRAVPIPAFPGDDRPSRPAVPPPPATDDPVRWDRTGRERGPEAPPGALLP